MPDTNAMTEQDIQQAPGILADDDPGAMPENARDGRTIARFAELDAMSVQKLEERRLIHRHDSLRVQADAFRELRTRLLALGGDHSFVTLVASISPGCGGSFVARNLAAAFAFDEWKKSLLIDCDARHPAQHTAFGIEANHRGLMDYLEDPSIDISNILHSTGVPRLRLIPGGRTREITGESFTSPRMRTMIDSLRGRYDDRYVIIDAPPVQGSPDARILSELADFVVLVAGYGRVTTGAVTKAIANFPPDKLAGVVFNNRP